MSGGENNGTHTIYQYINNTVHCNIMSVHTQYIHTSCKRHSHMYQCKEFQVIFAVVSYTLVNNAYSGKRNNSGLYSVGQGIELER